MKLAAYLEQSEQTASDFANKIGLSAVSIHRYITGKATPRPDQMMRIYHGTDGQVRPEDFYPDIPPTPEPSSPPTEQPP